MVIVTFPDRATQTRAIGFLLGRFSAKFFKSGEHILPEAAVEALADNDFAFSVKGKATYEQTVAAIRTAVTKAVQRYKRSPH